MTQNEALAVLKTGANVFLTGEPGSGKTHTLRAYIRYLRNANIDVAVTASTGIAATHIGGVTIHSWSGIGIKKVVSDYDLDRIAANERVAKRIARTAVLVIDEISMLDAPTLASIDRVCQAIKQQTAPFGGLQVIFVGDFFQLPPVTRGQEESQFAFASVAWTAAHPLICYLAEQHRQEDSVFLDILSALRTNSITPEHCAQLDSRCDLGFDEGEAALTKLFSHNVDVDRMNQTELDKIEGDAKRFPMAHQGKEYLVATLKRGCLSPDLLQLKKGAVVMFTKNSPKGMFVNGTLGEVVGFDSSSRYPIIKTRVGRDVTAEPMDWTIQDNDKILARISQIPLRLAWAMTVHKSQGMSLDAAYIDLRSAFVAGQGYVALSRVRTLQGLYLAGYNSQALTVHPEVLSRDEDWRRESREVGSAFAKISPRELQTMHSNLIRAAGGKAGSSLTKKRQREGQPVRTSAM